MRMTIGHRAQQGNILVVTLVVGAIIGVTLASYLKLVSNQNQYTWRSQAWNSAMPLIEAGIEEALAHIHAHDTNNWGSDGWTLQDGEFVKQRTLGDGYYVTKISNSIPPVIIAEGYVREPLGTNFMNPRIVRVDTRRDKLFAKGMVAKGSIDLAGNNIKSDSFDSSDSNYSTDGRYDPAKAKDNGDVATNSSVIDSLNVWNAEVYGKVSTGPGGNVRIGRNGAVGSADWHAAGNTGIEPGYSSDDMNVFFPDVEEPFSGGYSVPSSGTVGEETYNYVLGTGNYKLSTLDMDGQQDMLVTGQAVLLVENNVKITGNAYIEVVEGASLQMYVSGADAYIGGNGVANHNTSALHFYYLGLPSNTSVSMAGNASFTGVLYAPQADLTLGGGGSDIYDFAGATISDSVKMNGHYRFHYDEALGKVGPDRGFIVTNWNEFTWTEE